MAINNSRRVDRAVEIALRTVLTLGILISAPSVKDWGAESCSGDEIAIEPLRPRSSPATPSWYPARLEIVLGDIQLLDRQICEVVIADKKRSVRSHRILHVRPSPTTPAEEALIDAIDRDDQKAVLNQLPAVIQARPAVWRQQWYTVHAISITFQRGHLVTGYNLIEQLDRLPLAAVIVAKLPLAWSGVALNETTITTDLEQMASPSAAVRLVACSRLLDTNQRQAASAELQLLATQTERPVIKVWAQFLLAARLPPAEMKSQSDELFLQIQRLPMVLRDGPLEMLVDRCQRYAMPDEARRFRLLLKYGGVHPLPTGP